jgi:glutathione S-transferase
MGKVPFLDTPKGPLSESISCAEYIEATYPQNPLLPSDPFSAAKIRELIIYLELHMELPARELYKQTFFGGQVSEATKERSRKLLVKGIAGFAKLAKFSPFVAGDQFTLADCAAIVHLPLISSACKIMYGEDLLAVLPAAHEYIKAMSERATVKKVNLDRKANLAEMMAKIAAK